MKLGALGGPILAFTSLAIMLAVIAVLVALILLDDRKSNPAGLRNTAAGPTIVSRPLASSYPFTPIFQLPEGSREVGVTTDTPGNRWFGQFVLPKPDLDEIANIRRQADSNGLLTSAIQGSGYEGFSFTGSQIEGAVQFFRIDAENHVIVITLSRYPGHE
jgi:hypothetical protein